MDENLKKIIESSCHQGFNLAVSMLVSVYDKEIQNTDSKEFKDGFNFAISLLKEAASEIELSKEIKHEK